MGRKLPAEVYTRDELNALLRACSTRGRTGIRNRALIATLWRSGLRIREALGLRPKDLSREEGTLRVLQGKGGKSRTVAMDDTAFGLVADWMALRAGIAGVAGTHPVFCTLQGRPLQSSYVRQVLPRLARKAGIHKRVHAHGLRHTCSVELAREGVPIPLIQAQLGHASVATTSRYLAHFGSEDLRRAVAERVW